MLIFNLHKGLILNLQGQELITCSQIMNRTLTMCFDETLNYDCQTEPVKMNMLGNPTKN